MSRVLDKIIEPGPTTMAEALLVLIGLLRGVGILLFDGVTPNTPAFRLALEILPATLWAWVLILLSATLMVAHRKCCRLYRYSLVSIFVYWLLWLGLSLASARSITVLPLLVPWVACCMAAAWIYLVHSWGGDCGSRDR